MFDQDGREVSIDAPERFYLISWEIITTCWDVKCRREGAISIPVEMNFLPFSLHTFVDGNSDSDDHWSEREEYDWIDDLLV